MNKNYFVIAMLLLVSVFISACEGSTSADMNAEIAVADDSASKDADIKADVKVDTKDVVDTVDKTVADAVNDLSLEDLYKYEMLKSFEYKTTASGTTTTIKHTNKADTIDGKAAWLQTTEASMPSGSVVTKTWLDKDDYSCIKIVSSVSVMGQNMDNVVDCPADGPSAEGSTDAKFELIGTESVTVPLGTYTAKKYLLNGQITYWYVAELPLPLKVAYSGATMELVSYS